MKAGRLPDRRGGRLGDRTFAVLFGAAYLTLLIHMPGRASLAEATPILAAGGLYVLIGTAGFARLGRGRLAPALLYLGVQLTLGG